MNIESALKTIGEWISKETELRKYPKGELLELSESLQALKSAIARQSVKSEDNWKELREEFMHNLRGCDTVTVSLSGIGSTDYSTEDIHNMIAALTDNQPVAKLATSEEVAEAIEYFEDTLQFISGEPQEKDHRLAITALQEYQLPSAIKWTGDNLREIINLTGWNESASSKWTWTEYEQVVAEKGLKIFTPDGSVMVDVGDWIIQNGKDCYVTRKTGYKSRSCAD